MFILVNLTVLLGRFGFSVIFSTLGLFCMGRFWARHVDNKMWVDIWGVTKFPIPQRRKHQFPGNDHMSHEKNPPTFHYTGWLIGILTMVYYNPYIKGSIIPYRPQPTRVFFIAHISLGKRKCQNGMGYVNHSQKGNLSPSGFK